MIRRIHGGDIVKVQKKLGLDKEDIIDFSANINPLGPPARILEVLQESLGEIINYPDPECQKLRDTISQFYLVDGSRLIFGNGASELIFILMKVLNPRRVLIPAPTFIEYQFAAQSVGSKVTFFRLPHEDGFSLPVSEVLKKLSQADILFLCNPNNPTGTLWERDKIEEIIATAQKKGTFIVLDEAFMDFLEKEQQYSLLYGKKHFNNMFVLRSMTKFFAIPGLRLGWGVGHPEIIKKMELAKDPWNVNILAQIAGREALCDQSYINKTKELIKKEKQYLYEQLAKFPELKPYFPAANYIFVELVNTSLDSLKLKERLSQKGCLIRDCSNYANLTSRFFRTAVRSREENMHLINALIEVKG